MRAIEITIGDLRIDVGEYRCPDTVVYIKIQTLDDVETEGKTVLIYGEQGLGDIIQFIRWAPELKERGAAKVIVHITGPLDLLLNEVNDGMNMIKESSYSPNSFILLMSCPM